MRNRKRELNLYSFYDVTGMQNHLEEMARKGWILDKITNMFWIYRADTPRDRHYAISYFPKASAFQPEPTAEQKAFQDRCRRSNWLPAAENAKLQIFYNDDPNPKSIYKKPDELIDSIVAVSKTNILTYIILIALVLMQTFMFIDRFKATPVDTLVDSLALSILTTLILLIIYIIIDMIHYNIWKRKAREAAKTGHFASTQNHLRPFFGILLLLSVIMILVSVFTSNVPHQRTYFILSICMVIILYVVVNGVRILMKKKKFSTAKNRTITLIVDVVLAVIMTVVLLTSIFRSAGSTPDSSESPYDMPLTLQTLIGEELPDTESAVRYNSSIFVSKSEVYQISEASDHSLSYAVIDVYFPPVWNMCFEQYLHRYDLYGKYDSEDMKYHYLQIEASDWDADAAWQLSQGSIAKPSYLLVYGHRIVELNVDGTLTEEQVKTCKEAFKN